MAKFETVFPRKALLAVIHASDDLQVDRNIQVAFDNGVDGVFLINHGPSALELRRMYFTARHNFPDIWMGLNFLDLSRSMALQSLPYSASGLWVDNAGVETDDIREAVTFWDQWASKELSALYFGGVAFKYQRHIDDPGHAAVLAAPFMDVIVTSGPATGVPPSVQKIRTMKEAVHERPLAIASGISTSNIEDYLPYVDCFLVATAISSSFTELDPERVKVLAGIIHG